MNASIRIAAGSIVLAVLAATAWPALAAQRTFVASYGVDTHPCSVTQPCRSFAVALSATSAGGEVIALDSGGYGPVSVLKSVSLIAAPGVYAGISVFSGQNGITVDAGPNDKVVIKGLSITGQGGFIGVVVGTSKQVHVESCVISGMQAQGILASLGAYVRVAASTIRSNAMDGIFFSGSGALLVENSQIVRNGRDGVWINDGANGTIRGSHLTSNLFDGLHIWQQTGSGTFTVSESDFSDNGNIGVKLWGIPSAGSPFLGASLDRISSNFNHFSGVEVIGHGAGNVNATVSRSQITLNDGYGIPVSGSGVALVTVADSAVDFNALSGIYAAESAAVIVNLNGNSIARNGVNDIQRFSPAVVRTYVNNATTGGGSDVAGSLTGVALK